MAKAKTLPLEPRTKDNEEILFDFFESLGVTSCTVTFNGSGDDGQIGDMYAVPDDSKIFQKKIGGVKIKTGTCWDENIGSTADVFKTDVTVQDLITEVCYKVLETHFYGWEDNDGSFGEFRFNTQTRKIELDFNENFMESRLTKYQF